MEIYKERKNIKLEKILEGFVSPVDITYNNGNFYIADQIGILYENNKVYLDLRSKLRKLNSKYDESGLLAAQFYQGRLFVFYTAENKNILSEIINKEERIILEIPTEYDYHHGGCIMFYNGYLFLSVGDGGPQKDPNFNAQNPKTYKGKILRININNYKVEIYAYGFRNPWRMSSYNDKIIVADVGYETMEKITFCFQNQNHGWPYYEGTIPTPWISDRDRIGIKYVKPVYEYSLHGKVKSTAIIGGHVVDDKYIFGDYSGYIYILDGNFKYLSETNIGEYIRSFGMINNELYVLTSPKPGPSGDSGKVYKVKY